MVRPEIYNLLHIILAYSENFVKSHSAYIDNKFVLFKHIFINMAQADSCFILLLLAYVKCFCYNKFIIILLLCFMNGESYE